MTEVPTDPSEQYTMQRDKIVAAIRDNPGCTIMLDNDCFYLVGTEPPVDDDDDFPDELPYLWEALAVIAGVNIEPV